MEFGALYNENEPYAVEWLRNLARAGHIAAGAVDARDIRELAPGDVSGATQAHFFAGLGGWSHALRLADWPDDVPVWTGSCPCQPFSQSGLGLGFADERHLWPVWFGLIRECRPSIIFGEQVASPAGLEWFDVVSTDLEGEGYAIGAADLAAAGVGAPHIRQRLFFVAVSDGKRCDRLNASIQPGRPFKADAEADRGRAAIELADSPERGRHSRGGEPGDPESAGGGRPEPERTSPWSNPEWVAGRDGKTRPIEPGTFPLAHGVPARVGKLRAYGNAIVPQVAATFIRAAREVINDEVV